MKSTLTNMIISLTGITLIVGAALGLVYKLTEDPIVKAQAEARIAAVSEILPSFDDLETTTVNELTVYHATKGDSDAGLAVETFSDNGFGGRITLMAGFDVNSGITGFKVLSHAETPGLGAKMDDWFRNDQVIGASTPLSVKQDGGNVDAITGATITSRAFTDALNKAREAFNDYYNGRK